MRLVRYAGPAGAVPGIVLRSPDGHRVRPVRSLVDHTPVGPPRPLAGLRLLAPTRPRTVVGMAHNTGPADRLLPPSAFLKPASTVVGPGDPVDLPDVGRVDAEAELAIVVGRRCRDLDQATALDAVLGWTCANDVTARDLQAGDDSWTRAKGFDTFTPLGPWIETEPDFDPDDVPVLLDGTGASTTHLARSVREVLAYLTSFMTLEPGDVVLTGAPGPSRALADGDVVTVAVPGLGELRNPVRVRAAAVAR